MIGHLIYDTPLTPVKNWALPDSEKLTDKTDKMNCLNSIQTEVPDVVFEPRQVKVNFSAPGFLDDPTFQK